MDAVRNRLRSRCRGTRTTRNPRKGCAACAPTPESSLRSATCDPRSRNEKEYWTGRVWTQEVAHRAKNLQRRSLVKVTDPHLTSDALANFRGRFFLLVDKSDGCWIWRGPLHSSGRGRYLWRSADGGHDRYVMANRVSYYLATGELPRQLRNLCDNLLCVKASHWRAKPSERWKPKRKAIRGRVKQLSDSEIRQIRLLDSFGSDEDEIGQQYGLTKRQVADIAMGKVRPEAGGRIRPSRHLGIKHYHQQFEADLQSLSMRPNEPPPVGPKPEVPRTASSNVMSWPVPRGMSYGQVQGRRLPRTRRW